MTRREPSPWARALAEALFLFDLTRGTDVAVVMRLDLQEEFQGSGKTDGKADKDGKKDRQTIALELVSERLF